MFVVAACLARLKGLVSDYRVEFSPVRNWLMYCPSFGFIGICSNQQKALALPGKNIHGFLWDLVLYLGFPDLGQWIMVGVAVETCKQKADGLSVQQSNSTFTEVSCPPREGLWLSRPSRPHNQSSWFRTQLLCDVRVFLFFHRPSCASIRHREKQFVGDFNLKLLFVWYLKQRRYCMAL